MGGRKGELMCLNMYSCATSGCRFWLYHIKQNKIVAIIFDPELFPLGLSIFFCGPTVKCEFKT